MQQLSHHSPGNEEHSVAFNQRLVCLDLYHNACTRHVQMNQLNSWPEMCRKCAKYQRPRKRWYWVTCRQKWFQTRWFRNTYIPLPICKPMNIFLSEPVGQWKIIMTRLSWNLFSDCWWPEKGPHHLPTSICHVRYYDTSMYTRYGRNIPTNRIAFIYLMF